MKAVKITFWMLGTIAAVGVALGAYWHIYTLAACSIMAYAIKKSN